MHCQTSVLRPLSSVFKAFKTTKILENPQKLKKSSAAAANHLNTTCATLDISNICYVYHFVDVEEQALTWGNIDSVEQVSGEG